MTNVTRSYGFYGTPALNQCDVAALVDVYFSEIISTDQSFSNHHHKTFKMASTLRDTSELK